MSSTREFVDTGVEWLDRLPKEWSVASLGRECWVRARLGWKGLKAEEYVEEGGFAMLSTPDIKNRDIDFQSAARITKVRFDESPEIMLQVGDVLLTKDGSTIGTSNIVRDLPEPATLNGSIALLTPSRNLIGRYLYYVTVSEYAQAIFDLLRGGAGVPHLFQRDLNRIQIPLPPLDEQRAIADYLDQETSQIDALVAKQEEFIGLLLERRSGLIAAGVTGRKFGEEVDDDASWLGTPPAGWLLGQIKHFGAVTLGKMIQSNGDGDDFLAPYMRAANVQPDGVLALEDVKSMWFNRRELRALDLRAGDVVVVEGGIGGYGRAAFVAESLEGWGFQNSINRIRPFNDNDGRYLAYFLIMARQRGFITAYCNIVSMPHLTSEKLAVMPMFLPPPGEQREIANRIDDQTSRIDTLIAKASEHIALAKERRSALITAAVTGQFDVRTARKAG